MYYDDAASLKLRYDLVNRAGLRGAGIWALGYDGTRPELRAALADKFLSDPTPPVVGITGSEERRVPESLAVGGYGRVVVDGLRLRSSPSTSAEIMTLLRDRDHAPAHRRSRPTRWIHVVPGVPAGTTGTPVDPMGAGGWVAALWQRGAARRPATDPLRDACRRRRRPGVVSRPRPLRHRVALPNLDADRLGRDVGGHPLGLLGRLGDARGHVAGDPRRRAQSAGDLAIGTPAPRRRARRARRGRRVGRPYTRAR